MDSSDEAVRLVTPDDKSIPYDEEAEPRDADIDHSVSEEDLFSDGREDDDGS